MITMKNDYKSVLSIKDDEDNDYMKIITN